MTGLAATGLEHEQVLVRTGERSGLPVIIAVHSTVLGQAVGGCRMWRYADWTDGLTDALRLSRAMTFKCSLAGLPLGGGKSVIALPPDVQLTPELRRAVLLDLGDAIESFHGAYGVGEDVGTTAEDMLVVKERTRWAYGLPESSGGMGEPSAPTAAGVYECLRVTSERVFGSADLSGRAVTIIGLGQVGTRLAERLSSDGAKLTVTDIDPEKKAVAAALGATWVDVADAVSTQADILVPAALGGLLTDESVPLLRCAAIVGPANNQLSDDAVADLLAARGIVWAPDFLVNAGGVVYGSNMEMSGRTADDAMAAVLAIGNTLRDIYDRAAADNVTPLRAAATVAEERVAAARGSANA
jgi:leucine dehydrogenase